MPTIGELRARRVARLERAARAACEHFHQLDRKLGPGDNTPAAWIRALMNRDDAVAALKFDAPDHPIVAAEHGP